MSKKQPDSEIFKIKGYDVNSSSRYIKKDNRTLYHLKKINKYVNLLKFFKQNPKI